MGVWDESARQTWKLNGSGTVAWALRRLTPAAPVCFARWDDTRRQSWPGGPERTDDAVAILDRLDAPGQVCYLIIESETKGSGNALHRLGVYELMLCDEVRTASDPPPMVGSVLIRLTGNDPFPRPSLGIPGTAVGSCVGPVEVILANEDAAATLADIEAGDVAPHILALIPLMAGADSAVAALWKQVAEQCEPDEERRRIYRDLALIMAEKAQTLVEWQRELGGWMMQESTLVNGWVKRGVQDGRLQMAREMLLKGLAARMKGPVPEPIRLAIAGTNDTDRLESWLESAVTTDSYADFDALMNQP